MSGEEADDSCPNDGASSDIREVEGSGSKLLAGTPPPDVVVLIGVDMDVGVELSDVQSPAQSRQALEAGHL